MGSLSHVTIFLTAAVLTSASVVKPAIEDTFELLILHNNDMHARFEQTSQLSGTCTTADRDAGKCYGGFPRVAHVVKEARKAAATGQGPPVLYLNAGDTYTGTAWFTIYKWQIAAEFLNALQPDAVSLGNHEFDNGVFGLAPFIEKLTCPILCVNLDLRETPELAKQTNLKKSIIIDKYKQKIGIIGYLTPETKKIVAHNEVEFYDEIAALQQEVTNLGNEGVKIIIALGHSGYTKDLQIAREVEDLDMVIGGHTNTFLWNGTTPDSDKSQGPYPTYITQASGRRVPVVQAYAYTKYLGKMNIVFDSEGEILSLDGHPILLDHKVPQDKDVVHIIDRYKTDSLYIGNEIIGVTSMILDGKSCYQKECNLGNLITDAMLIYYANRYKGKYWTDAPIAVLQAGGIRSSIANSETPTNITKADLMTVLPFGGSLVTVTLNGTIFKQILEHSVAKYNPLELPGEFLQYSGVKVIYDLTKSVGSRVVKAEVRCSDCLIPQYSNLDEKGLYKVIMPDFMTNGGDGYTMLKQLPTNTLHYKELTCTEYYVRKYNPVFAEEEGRIVILKEQIQKDSGVSLRTSSLALILIAGMAIAYL